MSSSQSSLYVLTQLGHTALLLSDVQRQTPARFPSQTQTTYLTNIKKLLTFFREQISALRASFQDLDSQSIVILLIIHRTFPFNLNNNASLSLYNELANWVRSLEAKAYFTGSNLGPHHSG